MLFQKKIDRAMNFQKEKNRDKAVNEDNLEYDNELDIEYEKNDLLALIVSALIVFGPIFLILIIIIIWTFKA